MKKFSCKYLLAFSALLANNAYSASFSDYNNYEVGENRELTVTGANEFALFGVTDISSTYGFTTRSWGHIGTMADIGDPNYGYFLAVGGHMHLGAGYPFRYGIGDYSINPSSVSTMPNNDLAYRIDPSEPDFFRLKGLRVLLNNDLTGPAKGFFIDTDQSVEWAESTVEYRGVSEGVYIGNNASFLMKDSQLIYANTSGDSYGIYMPGKRESRSG